MDIRLTAISRFGSRTHILGSGAFASPSQTVPSQGKEFAMATQIARLEQAELQATLSEARSPAKPRLVYIDNLRTVLITVVVLGHLSGTYGVDAGWMYVESGEVSLVAYILETLLVIIIVTFAMGLFFLIAGYFTPPAYDRKGVREFLLGRFKRLGIPWLFYEIFITPLVHYAVDVHGGDCHGALYDCQYQGTFWQYLREFPRLSYSFGDGPVWFLEALLFFSIFYALWRVLARTIKPPSSDAGRTRTIPTNGTIALFALAIGLCTFVVRFWAKAFVQYEPFHLEFARFPQYIAMFMAGVWAYRGSWLTAFPNRQVKAWRWVALGCMLALPALAVAFGALSGSLDERTYGGVNGLSLVFSLWEGFLSVSMVITILDWFRCRFDHQGRLARVMSDTAFIVYVIHPAVIVPLALALSGIQMNLSLKFLLMAPIAVSLCYLVAYALSKVPVVKTILG
jgi:glucan biosynthesis protein C